MSLACMPWLMCNLGSEMVYVLEQRLKAQSISGNKTARVLQDVVTTMFDRAFLEDKLFVPQETYSLNSTKKIFERLAHSSIMRLSDASMDKLFDLMVMGVKYQLMCCTTLGEMMQITQRHLRNLRQMVAAAGAVACTELVMHAEVLARKFYGGLSNGQLALMRQTLMRFFQDKRVRISLFLSEGIQAPGGKIVLPSCLHNDTSSSAAAAVPSQSAGDGAPIGRIRTFDSDGQLESVERAPLAVLQVDPCEFFCHPAPLGDNLYSKDRAKVVPPARTYGDAGAAAAAAAAAAGGEAPLEVGGSRRPTAEEQAPTEGSKQALRELDFLAGLIKGPKGSGSTADAGGPGVSVAAGDNFRLNIFQGEEGQAAVPVKAAAPRELEFGAGGRNDAYRRAAGLTVEGLSLDGGLGGGAGVDLLELMDSTEQS